MNETEQKLLFAQWFVKDPTNPLAAARVVFGNNLAAALAVFNTWPNDPVIIDEVARLKKTHGERHFLPTLEEAARMLLDEARAAQAAGDRGEFRQLMKLYNETMGFIQKPGVTINNSQVVNRVMEVDRHGTNDEWEATLLKQQEILSNDSAEPITIN